MRKEILFGAAYYPEYLPCDRIKKDLVMMKEAGMNVVRIAESTWSTLEPEEGRYNFSYVDRVLEEAQKLRMYVIIGTPTYAIPSWLVKKDPSVMVETKEGRTWYGHRQKMDLVNPTFRACAEAMIRKLFCHTAEHKAVIGFQLDNETKHYGSYSSFVQQMFLEYLKEKFKTTKTLNQTFGLAYWSNSIENWEDFPDMRGCINGGLAGEFEAFKRSLAADYLKWQADILAEYKREDQFVTHNFDFEWKKFGADIAQDGYSYGVQPDINHYEASKAVTLAGTDIYHPTQDALTGAEIAFGGDCIRSLKADNYLVLECQAQAFKYWTPYPGQLRLHAYSHLASGASGLLYWNWHSIHNGYETYWKGLLSHDMEPNPVYEEAKQFGQEWKKKGAERLCLSKQNEIALVIDNRSLTALQWFPIDKKISYNDVVRYLYDSLYELNLECDVVDIHALEPSRYKMILTPALYSISEADIKRLEQFVLEGGVLFSTFKSFAANEQLSVYPDRLPHLLNSVFGMYYQQYTQPDKVSLLGEPVTGLAELLCVGDAQVLGSYQHKYWKAYAGITKNRAGKGMGYYLGCLAGKEVLKKVLKEAALDAGITLSGITWPVIVRSGINQAGDKLQYWLNYSSQPKEFSCPCKKGEELLTENVYARGEKIRLEEWGVAVLKEMEE
ncbi:beta-galactosidase [Lacrimispora sp. JR3]|uniref:beta-galactosidase n=1 Tax=Lacrimispora sinapis TaxID=3111456 RepID=UPI003748D297